MPQRSRIRRSVEDAETALHVLNVSSNANLQQKAWEDFLSAWRTSLNRLSAFYRENGLSHVVESMHTERLSDPLLDYVWEARNVEEHAAYGTTDPALQLIAAPFTFAGMPFTFEGKPFTFSSMETVLRFRNLEAVRYKAPVTLIAPSQDPYAVAESAMAYLRRALVHL